MPPTRSSTRAGGGLNLAALTNPAPASTELPDDDFDPTGGALTRDDDGDASDGDGFSDDDDDALDRDDGVFRPTEDDEKASGKGGRLRMRGGLSLDELGAEYQGKRTSRKAMEDAWAGEGDDDDDDSAEGLDADDLARMEREAADDDDDEDDDDGSDDGDDMEMGDSGDDDLSADAATALAGLFGGNASECVLCLVGNGGGCLKSTAEFSLALPV